jgi:hypothetical protein
MGRTTLQSSKPFTTYFTMLTSITRRTVCSAPAAACGTLALFVPMLCTPQRQTSQLAKNVFHAAALAKEAGIRAQHHRDRKNFRMREKETDLYEDVAEVNDLSEKKTSLNKPGYEHKL